MENKDKIKSQLTDSGSVIGYRPDLQYSKSASPSADNISSIGDAGENYSQTVKSFLENLPSTVIMDVADTIATIDDAIDRLKQAFDEDITTFSSIVIPTSIIPDIIIIMVAERERLQILNDTLKLLYYGTSSLSDDAYKKKDEKMVSQIISSEKDETLNYLTMSYDTLQLKSISIYSSKVDAAILQLEQAAYETDDTKVLNKNFIAEIEALYKETDIEEKDRTSTYNIQQSTDVMKKTLYNYYLKRSSLKQFFDIAISCASEGSYLLNKLDKYDADVKQSIEEINKVSLGNVYYLNSIEDLMNEKQHLISLCATLSYN